MRAIRSRSTSAVTPRSSSAVLAAAGYQFELVDGADQDGGSILVRPSLDLALTDVDHVHLTLAFAGGDGVNDVTSFEAGAWFADLESDLRDVNGAGRDHLQMLWYRRMLIDEDDRSLAAGS